VPQLLQSLCSLKNRNNWSQGQVWASYPNGRTANPSKIRLDGEPVETMSAMPSTLRLARFSNHATFCHDALIRSTRRMVGRKYRFLSEKCTRRWNYTDAGVLVVTGNAPARRGLVKGHAITVNVSMACMTKLTCNIFVGTFEGKVALGLVIED